MDHVHIERSEIEETGEYDLEGLFVRLGHAIDSIGARRVVLDTIETLFAGLSDDGHPAVGAAPPLPLAEGRDVTAVITGERGEGPSPATASRSTSPTA